MTLTLKNSFRNHGCHARRSTSQLPLVLLIVLCCTTTSSFALAAAATPRTVLVTGGAGYIGSHTCLELLNIPGEQYKVIVVDNLDNSSEESLKRVVELTECDPKRLIFRNCDIRDKQGLKNGENACKFCSQL
jgi:FlaA1/EpsC-like NDP-sugar epimerase